MEMETRLAGTRLKSVFGKKGRKREKEFLDTSWRTMAMNFIVVKMGARIRKKKNGHQGKRR